MDKVIIINNRCFLLNNITSLKFEQNESLSTYYLKIDNITCGYNGPLKDLTLLRSVLYGFLGNDEKVLNFDLYER